MRVGVFLLAAQFPGQEHGEVLTRTLECAVAAEQAGFDDVWIAEHHFIPYEVCPSAATFAAMVLGRTSRITVGTAVSVLSTAHPVALAEQTALLDHLSAGRFHLGVGRGGPWVDLEVFGTGLDRYETGFTESLDLLLTWLESERVGAAGPRFRFREVAVAPRPRTRLRPPVTVACTSPDTVRVAAERGLPMLLGMHIGDEEKAELVNTHAAIAARHGYDPATVPHIGAALAQVADSRAEALVMLRTLARTDLVTADSPDDLKQDATFWIRPGLARPGGLTTHRHGAAAVHPMVGGLFDPAEPVPPANRVVDDERVFGRVASSAITTECDGCVPFWSC